MFCYVQLALRAVENDEDVQKKGVVEEERSESKKVTKHGKKHPIAFVVCIHFCYDSAIFQTVIHLAQKVGDKATD